MNFILQLLLATTLFAGLYCSSVNKVSNPETEVLETNFYGIEDPERVEEPEEEVVTTTVSSRRSGGRGRWSNRKQKQRGEHSHHDRTWNKRKNYTMEEKLEHVCQSLESHRSRSNSRYVSEKVGRLEPSVREQIARVIANRKERMLECCGLVDAARMECATNFHKERYNRVCNNEEPLCIWVLMKGGASQTTATVEKCCAFQDDERVSCFVTAKSSYQKSKWQKKKHFII